MSLMNELEELGVNVDEALKRFMNNSGLYTKMLGKLAAAVSELDVMQHFESGNFNKALENAHTLKGITGNLSIIPLYKAYTDIVALLRADDPEKAKKILEDIIPVQEKIISCIEENT